MNREALGASVGDFKVLFWIGVELDVGNALKFRSKHSGFAVRVHPSAHHIMTGRLPSRRPAFAPLLKRSSLSYFAKPAAPLPALFTV
jgi:hypothetical protein